MNVAPSPPSPNWLDEIRRRCATSPPSGIVEVFNYGRGRQGLIPLWVGEGDLPTPPFIGEAAKASLDRGETFYTEQRGIPELREAIAAYMTRVYGAAPGRRRFLARELLRHHRRHARDRDRDPDDRRPRRRGADPVARLAEFRRRDRDRGRAARAGPTRPRRALEPRSRQARRGGDAGDARHLLQFARQSDRLRRHPRGDRRRRSRSRAAMGFGSSPTRSTAA